MKFTKKFKLELITREKVLINDDVSFVVVPSGAGPIGILPGHAPLLGLVVIGILRVVDAAQKEFRVFVTRGFFMISREGVTIIAENAELEDQINLQQTLAAKKQAQALLASAATAKDREHAQEALLRAETKIKLLGSSAAR